MHTKLRKTATLTSQQKHSLCALWNREYPLQLSFESFDDFENYLFTLQDAKHFIVTGQKDVITGWAFIFTRDQVTWFAIIVDSTEHHQGIGTKMINTLKTEVPNLSGWVVDHDQYVRPNGTTYPSPLKFYVKNGFTVCKEIRLETDQLSAVKITWQ